MASKLRAHKISPSLKRKLSWGQRSPAISVRSGRTHDYGSDGSPARSLRDELRDVDHNANSRTSDSDPAHNDGSRARFRGSTGHAHSDHSDHSDRDASHIGPEKSNSENINF